MSVIDYSWDFSKEEFSLDLDFFNEKEQEDKMWQARTGLNYETLCGAIETIIFMNDKPIPLLKIKNQIDSDLPLRVVHESIAKLQAEYEQKHHGIRLMEVAQGYQFRTKATYSKIVQNMFKVQSLQLSPTALEVLAMVAYKQPISKNAIESIRGVDSSHVVRALMDRRLVKIVGRSEEVGRPSLYGTSAEFLEIFNLNTIDDLPSEIELEELANANEIGQISDIKTIVQSGDKKRFDVDELLELDKISESIQDIASDTSFIQSLKSMDKTRTTEEGVEKKSAFDILEEYVNKAQIVEQNKHSAESEVLTSVMEPRPVTLSMINELLNAPEVEEDEVDAEVELETGEIIELALDDSENDHDFELIENEKVNELEVQADDILERSQALLDSMSSGDESLIDAQTKSLEDDVDSAFAKLLDETEESEEVEAAAQDDEEEINFDDLDISSFIGMKLQQAQGESGEEVEEDTTDEANKDESEESMLSSALDEAFANLTGENLSDDNEEEEEESFDNIDLHSIQADLESSKPSDSQES